MSYFIAPTVVRRYEVAMKKSIALSQLPGGMGGYGRLRFAAHEALRPGE